MITRLNYTGRKRIRRQDARIELLRDAGGRWMFSAQLVLDAYDLPRDAPIFVEAERQLSWRRFPFGTVGDMETPQDCSLTQFGCGEGVRFRVKVVERQVVEAPRLPARILAQADRIGPQRRVIAREEAESLLPVEWGEDNEFRHQPWRLEFVEDTEPILRISRYLVSDRHAFVRSREFVCLVIPELFRSILLHLLLLEKAERTEGDWRSLWIRFARTLPGLSPLPEPDDVGLLEDWIDEAVWAFSRGINLGRRFKQWWAQEA